MRAWGGNLKEQEEFEEGYAKDYSSRDGVRRSTASWKPSARRLQLPPFPGAQHGAALRMREPEGRHLRAPPPRRRTALRMRRRGCPRCWTPTTRGRQSARSRHRACAKRPYRGGTAGNPRPASPLALRMCEQRRLAAAPHHTTRGAGAQHRDPQSPGTGPGPAGCPAALRRDTPGWGRPPRAALPSSRDPGAGAGLNGSRAGPCCPS